MSDRKEIIAVAKRSLSLNEEQQEQIRQLLSERDALKAEVDRLKSASTPSAKWREEGKPDPHEDQYNCERAALTLGNYTDDELANAVFLHGNEPFNVTKALAGEPMPIVYLTAAKDRIRWLSRQLEKAKEQAND